MVALATTTNIESEAPEDDERLENLVNIILSENVDNIELSGKDSKTGQQIDRN